MRPFPTAVETKAGGPLSVLAACSRRGSHDEPGPSSIARAGAFGDWCFGCLVSWEVGSIVRASLNCDFSAGFHVFRRGNMGISSVPAVRILGSIQDLDTCILLTVITDGVPWWACSPLDNYDFQQCCSKSQAGGGVREGVCAPLAYFVMGFIQGHQKAVIQTKHTGGRVWAGGSLRCGTCAPHQFPLMRGRDIANPPQRPHWQQR